ncbi:MAG: hypothetical protein RIS94_1248 [Pseudomonadota bacterium]|jgi:DNA topoisomerase-1
MHRKAGSDDRGKTPLLHVEDSLAGIRRRRMKRGWGYWDADGKRITDRDEIDRLLD